jgi:hypothetical protein
MPIVVVKLEETVVVVIEARGKVLLEGMCGYGVIYAV